MKAYKIVNQYSGKFLDSGVTTISGIHSNPEVQLNASSNSISQLWYVDHNPTDDSGSYGLIHHIRSVLDVNFGITLFADTHDGKCGITNISYYEYMSRNPFNPYLNLASLIHRGVYDIMLSQYSLYLYDGENNGPCWANMTSVLPPNVDMRYLWTFVEADYEGCSLVMPQNMSQLYSGYPDYFRSAGCYASCVADCISHYTGKNFTLDDLISNGVIKKGDPIVQYHNKACTVNADNNVNFDTIKSHLDDGEPVILHLKKDDRSHYVLTYGYKGTCTAENMLVMDPAGETKRDIGKYTTLSEVLNGRSIVGLSTVTIKQTIVD